MHSLFPRSSEKIAQDKLHCCCQCRAGRPCAPRCQSHFCHGTDWAHGALTQMPSCTPQHGGHFGMLRGTCRTHRTYVACENQEQFWLQAALGLKKGLHLPWHPPVYTEPPRSWISLPCLEIGNISHWRQDWLYPQSTQTINASLSSPNSCQRSWSF